MANFVDTTVKDIDARLRELQQEVAKLQAARSALVGNSRGAGRSRRSRAARPARPAPRARAARARRTARPGGGRGRGTRASQALALVRKTPGITIPAIAKSMGIEPNYLYRVLPKLEAQGQVRRDGQGWHPATQAAAEG